MTTTTEISAEETEIWRDESIDCILDIFNGEITADYDSLTAASEALHDVHVRDVMLFYINTLDSDGLKYAASLLTEAVMFAPHDRRAPVATMLSIIYAMVGIKDQCVLANTIALLSDPDYTLANLIEVMLNSTGDHAPEFINNFLDCLDYDDCRYGARDE